MSGREVYPRRPDLGALPYWRCACGLFVGCHHRTSDRTRPLGVIPTPEISAARRHLHALIDPIWKSGIIARTEMYARIAVILNIPEYHTAELRSVEDARAAYRAAQKVIRGVRLPS